MLIKIDHTVASLIREDRADVVTQLKNSAKMYSWAQDENVGDTVDRFAVANPRATFGDFIEWTKRTYLDRLRAIQDGTKFTNFKLAGDYNPTIQHQTQAQFGKHGSSVDVITDAVSARPKAGPKKVAEPGSEQEKLLDAEDSAALAAEPTDNPLAPPTNLNDLKPVEPGQRSETPLAAALGKRGL